MKKVYFNDTYKQTEAVIAGSKTMFHAVIPFITICGDRLVNMYEPRFKIGETVAVAQSMHDVCKESDPEFKTLGYLSHCFGKAWTNKMFVEASRMPHQIKITNISIKSLQGISDEDCLREGVIKREEGHGYIVNGIDRFTPHGNAIAQQVAYYYEPIVFDSPREAFADLIDKLNGEGTWNFNPLTIFFEFELIK